MTAEVPAIPSLDDGTWLRGGATPHHAPAAIDPALLTISDIDHLLAWHVLPVPEVAYLTREGANVSPERYVRPGASTHRAADAPGIAWRLVTLDVDRTIDELASGATLSLTSVQRQLPAVEALLRRLSRRWTVETSANVYLSGPRARGGLHHDLHDVLVLQVAGTKTWELHGPPPGWRDPSTIGTAGPDAGTVRLEPGDLLHVPGGWPHLVTTGDDAWSLHLTVALRPLTIDRLGADDLARPPQRGALDGNALRDPARFAATVAERWDAERRLPDDRASLERLRAEAVQVVHRSGPPAGRLTALAGTTRPLPAQLVPRWVPWAARHTDDGVVVHAAGRTVALPAAAAVALPPLLEGRSLDVEGLVAHCGTEVAASVVRPLITAGFARGEGGPVTGSGA